MADYDYPVALNPAQEDPETILDMNTAVGFKMFKHATRAILETDKYDLSSTGFQMFLDSVKDRIEEQQWDYIFNIPKLPTGNQILNIATHFGQVSYEDVIHHDTDFKTMTGVEEDDYPNLRHIQNSAFSYTAILASLTDAAKQRLSHSRHLYIIGNKGSGPLLLHTIISKAYVVNKGTCLHLRQKLQQLDIQMNKLDDNVIAFNEYVHTIIAQLDSFGENVNEDLLANLFTGYGAVDDDAFAEWLQRKRNQYEEEEVTTLSPDKLMAAAELKYSTLLDQETGANLPSPIVSVKPRSSPFKLPSITYSSKIPNQPHTRANGELQNMVVQEKHTLDGVQRKPLQNPDQATSTQTLG